MISKLLLAATEKKEPLLPPGVKWELDNTFGKQSDNVYC